MITIRKVKGGYVVFKDDKQWTGVYSKKEAQNVAKYMRESKYGSKSSQGGIK